MLRKSPMWTNKSVEKHFPPARFIECVDSWSFPTECMIVSEDRRRWSWSAYPNMKPVVLLLARSEVPQTELFTTKHFRSSSDCTNVIALKGTAAALATSQCRTCKRPACLCPQTFTNNNRRCNYFQCPQVTEFDKCPSDVECDPKSTASMPWTRSA